MREANRHGASAAARVKAYTTPDPSRLRGAPTTSVLPSAARVRPKSSMRDESGAVRVDGSDHPAPSVRR